MTHPLQNAGSITRNSMLSFLNQTSKLMSSKAKMRMYCSLGAALLLSFLFALFEFAKSAIKSSEFTSDYLEKVHCNQVRVSGFVQLKRQLHVAIIQCADLKISCLTPPADVCKPLDDFALQEHANRNNELLYFVSALIFFIPLINVMLKLYDHYHSLPKATTAEQVQLLEPGEREQLAIAELPDAAEHDTRAVNPM